MLDKVPRLLLVLIVECRDDPRDGDADLLEVVLVDAGTADSFVDVLFCEDGWDSAAAIFNRRSPSALITFECNRFLSFTISNRTGSPGSEATGFRKRKLFLLKCAKILCTLSDLDCADVSTEKSCA